MQMILRRAHVLAISILAVSAAALALAGSASAFQLGSLSPFSPPSCLNASAPCVADPTYGQLRASVPVDDVLYVAFDNNDPKPGLVSFRINPNGSIGAKINCIQQAPVTIPGCSVAAGLDGAYIQNLKSSADHKTLYVSADPTAGKPSSITAFAIDSATGLGALRNCLVGSSAASPSGCAVDDRIKFHSSNFDVSSNTMYAVGASTTQNIFDTLEFRRLDPDGKISTDSYGCKRTGAPGLCAEGSLPVGMQPWAVAVGPGALYVSDFTPGHLRSFALSPNGAVGAAVGDVTDPALSFPDAIAVSPSGSHLYSDSTKTGPDPEDTAGRLLSFPITPGGSIGPRDGCLAGNTAVNPLPAGCMLAPSMNDSMGGVAVTPDGQTVTTMTAYVGPIILYSASVSSTGAINGLSNCVTPSIGLAGCTTTHSFDRGWVSATDRAVYVGGTSLAAFSRALPPSCTPVNQNIYAGLKATIKVSCTDANGDAVSLIPPVVPAIFPPPFTNFDAAARSFTYTPRPKFVGIDQFNFVPTDGGLNGSEVTVTLNVAKGPTSKINAVRSSVKAS
ncbi:MAG: hypothetical protein ACRDKE_05650, partial [Solirubrobacterales bacterium]